MDIYFLFSPCGNYLYTDTISPAGENCIELSKYELLPAPLSSCPLPRLIDRVVYVDPLPEWTRKLVIKDGEPHLLRHARRSLKTTIILFHIAFDGTAKWKLLGSMPRQSMNCTMELAGWDVKAKGGRVDIVLTRYGLGGEVDVITTWEDDDWDEEKKVEVVLPDSSTPILH
jgi:hypothetical protein